MLLPPLALLRLQSPLRLFVMMLAVRFLYCSYSSSGFAAEGLHSIWSVVFRIPCGLRLVVGIWGVGV